MSDQQIYRIIDAFREGKKIEISETGFYLSRIDNERYLLSALENPKNRFYINDVEISHG